MIDIWALYKYIPCRNGHRFIYASSSADYVPHDSTPCECGRWTYGELKAREDEQLEFMQNTSVMNNAHE